MGTIKITDLYKVFGSNPQRGLEPLREGVHRDQVYEDTGQFGAVNAVNLEIEPGQIFVVMGLSGSGKSTLVRMINRLLEATAGTVEIDGDDVGAYNASELRDLRAHRVSMVFQGFGLLPHRTVRENAEYGLKVQKVPAGERRSRAGRALVEVGLEGWEDRPVHELSGGMRQRVGLARALATDADILLMDEPFSALDPLIRRDMQQQLLELQSDLQKTIVFITHDLNEAMLLGDQVAVMKDGYIVQNDPPETILNHPADDYVAEFVQDVDRSRVLTAESVMVKPLRTVSPGHGPKVVSLMMNELQTHSLYVVDQRHHLVGVVTDQAAAEAAKRGVQQISEIVSDDHPTANRDTLLSDLLYDASQSPNATAVVEDGRLVGVVPRAVLLNSLSTETVETQETTGESPAIEPSPPDTAGNGLTDGAPSGTPETEHTEEHDRG